MNHRQLQGFRRMFPFKASSHQLAPLTPVLEGGQGWKVSIQGSDGKTEAWERLEWLSWD